MIKTIEVHHGICLKCGKKTRMDTILKDEGEYIEAYRHCRSCDTHTFLYADKKEDNR